MAVNTPQKLVVLERKIRQHADTLMTRHVPDINYAKTKFAGGYDQAAFKASFGGTSPAVREPANLLCAAWDNAMNDLNEVLRNAYGLEHGQKDVGPPMPVVYAEPKLALSRVGDLQSVNQDRNLLTHDYPVLVADDLYDAVELFLKILKTTLQEVKVFTMSHGIDIPAVP